MEHVIDSDGVEGAVLDANVLFPNYLRDVLLRAALTGLFRPHWSEAILAEVERNLVSDLDILPEQAARVTGQMRLHFPQAMVPTWPQRRLDTLTNHPKDRHVLAAAIASRSSIIVTGNTRDFRAPHLEPHGVRAITADRFLLGLLDAYEDRLLDVLRRTAAGYRREPKTAIGLAEKLAPVAPGFSLEAARRLKR